MLVTSEMIYNKLETIEKLLLLKLEKNTFAGLQEFTLNQTAKILRMSTETLRIKAENQEIESLIDEKSNAKGGVTFKFTSIHIKEFQERRRFKGLNPNMDTQRTKINQLIEKHLEI